MKEKDIVKKIKEIEKFLDSIPIRRRLKQLEKWLRKNFITPYPVQVRVERISGGSYGECYRRDKRIVIRINKETSRHEQLSSLIHEWAHAVTWPNPRLEKLDWPEHSDEWGLTYSKIYREWFDLGGFLKSTGMSVDEIILRRMIVSEYAG